MTNRQSNKVLIITGMHRSGTSLSASLFQSAGIDIGDRLMSPSEGNPRGFFEDWDFVEFHEAVLSSQGIASEGWTKEKSLKVQGQYLARAQSLILARRDKAIWGWKDPRTTLFLDFWVKLIPKAKFVLVFRSPWEVVDSLFRRGDLVFQTNPNFALEQWFIYNRAILDFYQRYQEQCLLLDLSSIINHPDDIINLMNHKFKLKLQEPKPLYEKSLMTVDSNSYYRQSLISELFPQVIDLYGQLQQQADRKIHSIFNNQYLELANKSWFLQDWCDLKQSQKQLKIAQEQVEQLQSLLHSIESNKFWKLIKRLLSLKQKFKKMVFKYLSKFGIV